MTAGVAERAAVRERAEAVLRRLAGEQARLREDQWRAIEALVVDRRRVLCVQRTGWGKSAVYFVATALLRDHAAMAAAAGAGAGGPVAADPLVRSAVGGGAEALCAADSDVPWVGVDLDVGTSDGPVAARGASGVAAPAGRPGPPAAVRP